MSTHDPDHFITRAVSREVPVGLLPGNWPHTLSRLDDLLLDTRQAELHRDLVDLVEALGEKCVHFINRLSDCEDQARRTEDDIAATRRILGLGK